MLLQGEIKGYKDGMLWCAVPMPESELERIKTSKREVTIEIEDGRLITMAQRRKCYVLIRYIADWWGYTPPEAMKEILKYDFFTADGYEGLNAKTFSLSDAPRSQARAFISFLIGFCLEHDIPCGEPLWKLTEDIPRYVYVAALHKRCAVCGKRAQWHHAEDRVGMGRSRSEICHIGMRGLPLCARHHSECHNMPQSEFNKMYLLESIKVDERIADIYRLRKTAKNRR